MKTIFKVFPLIFLALPLVLAACQPSSKQDIPTLAPQLATASPLPTDIPGVLLLISNSQFDPESKDEISEALAGFALENSLTFQTVESLNQIDFTHDIFAIVSHGSFPTLPELANTHSEYAFIAIDSDIDNPPENLTLIKQSSSEQEKAAFLSGYAAALSTDDWRIGALYISEDRTEATAFIAGVEYFCGACGPVAPPYNNYPQAFQSTVENWQIEAQAALDQGIRTIYLSPGLEHSTIQDFFVQRGILLVGSQISTDISTEYWLGSFSASPQSGLIPELLSALGETSSPTMAASVEISELNHDLISETRLEHLLSILADMDSGLIGMPSQLD